MSQCVAVCCSVLQYVAVGLARLLLCRLLVYIYRNVFLCVTVYSSALLCVPVCSSVLQCVSEGFAELLLCPLIWGGYDS